jgi:uncharacterized protein (TIGR02118 family)
VAVRLIALYNQPDDPAAFDAHYRDVHAPMVRRYPGLRDLRLTRTDGLGGRPPAFYLIAEMAFDSRADLDAAMASEPGVESGRDLRNFASAGVTLLVVDDDATEPGP